MENYGKYCIAFRLLLLKQYLIIRYRNDYLEIWKNIDDNPRKWLIKQQAGE